jgi:hypothetical protein
MVSASLYEEAGGCGRYGTTLTYRSNCLMYDVSLQCIFVGIWTDRRNTCKFQWAVPDQDLLCPLVRDQSMMTSQIYLRSIATIGIVSKDDRGQPEREHSADHKCRFHDFEVLRRLTRQSWSIDLNL